MCEDHDEVRMASAKVLRQEELGLFGEEKEDQCAWKRVSRRKSRDKRRKVSLNRW